MGLPRILFVALAFAFMAGLPHAAFAYIGPGAGITAIGTAIALVGGVILAIVGFVWYPIKRLIRSRRKDSEAEDPSAE